MRRLHSILPLLATACLLSTAACKNKDGDEGAEGGSDTTEGGLVVGPAATNLAVAKVSINQGVEVTLHLNGSDVSDLNTGLVLGRTALVRVFVAPLGGWLPREIQGVLTLEGDDGTKEYESILNVNAVSTDANLGSTFNFVVPGEDLVGDQAMSVSLHEIDDQTYDGDSSQSMWPSAGSYDANFTAVGPLRITLVPIQYDADGSGRLPDVSDEQIQRFVDGFMGKYPIPDVEFTVADPFPWGSPVGATNGGSWSQLLSAITGLRGTLGLGNDEYIYGLFAPADNVAAYCGAGCIAGLSALAMNPGDGTARSSIGLGFSGVEPAVGTMIHEVGHAHGREHAPCMLFGQPSDPGYPYPNAALGVWGWDSVSGVLKDPDTHTDFMSYCMVTWVSDYTYDGLFARSVLVNQLGMNDEEPPMREWSSTWVDEQGIGTSVQTVMLAIPDTEQDPHRLRFRDAKGDVIAQTQARFYPFDHLPGGLLYWPLGPKEAKVAEIEGFGRVEL